MKNKNTSLVVGLGEVGKAVQVVLECDGIDKGEAITDKKYQLLHICIPYSDKFVEIVNEYKDIYLTVDGVVVIHSTVPPGTSDAVGAVHSPIRGVHPNLEEGVRTFVKYFGGRGAAKAAMPFIERGIECSVFSEAKTTELLKLVSTTQYGAFIQIQKGIHDLCEKYGVDFDIVYTDANKTYNEGYKRLGMEHVVRPILRHVDGPIGGHCVLPNAKLLNVDLNVFKDAWSK